MPHARALLLVGLLAACGKTELIGPDVTVVTVSVAPDTARVAPGGQASFSAVPRNATGAPVVGRAVSWTVSNGGVASISTNGLVTGVSPGIAQVIATVDGTSGSATVVVEAAVPLTVTDDFERTDGPLGSSWLDSNNQLTIESGEVSLASLGGGGLGRWVANTFGPDQFSEVTVGTLNGRTFDYFRGLQAFVRQQMQGTPWRYGCHYFSNTLTYQIKYDGGPTADTRIVDETGQEPLPVTGDRIRIEAMGDTIRCYVNDQLKLQGVDGALPGGAIGFVIGLNPGATELPRGIVDVWSGGER